jgi:endonuclease/exonuclease/phosphatase family metal-dependent hydrolase
VVGRAGRLLFGILVVVLTVGPAAPRPAVSLPAVSLPAVSLPADSLPAVSLPAGTAPVPSGRPVVGALSVLQMNLCNSGMAGCYQGGRAVPEAAAVVAAARPDAVTLDEICRHDLTALAAGMRQAFPGDVTYQQFQPVHQRDDAISSCVNGDQYGIGILIHLRAGSPGPVSRGAEYPGQEGRRGERRVWECVYAIGSHYVCATHLSAFDHNRALAQCRYLMDTAIPDTHAQLGGYFPTVVGGDLNLTDRGSPNTGDCTPPGWLATGDGGVQHILVTPDHTVVSTRRLAMTYTDHPALLVTLQPTKPKPGGS